MLVTGATGRIGANLCRVLRERGFRIRAIVLPGDPAVAKLAGLDAEIVEADLRDEQAVVRACEGVDAICHLAALMGPDAGEMPVPEYWHLNVDATLHVLEGARLNGNLASGSCSPAPTRPTPPSTRATSRWTRTIPRTRSTCTA